MDVQSLVKLNPKKVRNDENLMRLYIDCYKDAFSVEPDCAPCTFTRDFDKLKKAILTGPVKLKERVLKTPNMAKTKKPKYELKRKYRSQIFTYREGKKPFRTYGHLMTDEFAEKFIENSADEKQKQERLAFFDVVDGKPTGKQKAQKPEDKKPEDKKPEDKKPEDKKPEDKKPEDKKPEDKKPEDKKPEDKKPEDKTPEAKDDFSEESTETDIKKLRTWEEVEPLLEKHGMKREDYANLQDAKNALLML